MTILINKIEEIPTSESLPRCSFEHPDDETVASFERLFLFKVMESMQSKHKIGGFYPSASAKACTLKERLGLFYLFKKHFIKFLSKFSRKLKRFDGLIRIGTQRFREACKVLELVWSKLQHNHLFFHDFIFKKLSFVPATGLIRGINGSPRQRIHLEGILGLFKVSEYYFIFEDILKRFHNLIGQCCSLSKRGSGSYSDPGRGRCPLSLYPTPILLTSGAFFGALVYVVTMQKSLDHVLFLGTLIWFLLRVSAISLAISFPKFCRSGFMLDIIVRNGEPKFLEFDCVRPVTVSYRACASSEYNFVEFNNSNKINH